MPHIAIAGYVVFMLLAFGLRGWVHYRRTGTTGFVGISGRLGSSEWFGGALFAAALVIAAAAPVLQLADAVTPLPGLDTPLAHAFGLAAYVAGVAGTLWAQFAMGESWRIGVDTSERTRLVASGPFRWVRNPIFTAMTLATAGLVLLVPNAVALLALIVLIAAIEIQVRLVEEPYLTAAQGEPYRLYTAATGRFVPGIGRR